MTSMWLVIPFVALLSNPAESIDADSHRKPAPIGHLTFEVPVTKELRKALESELFRLGRTQLIGIDDMYATRARMQKIVDRNGLTNVRVTMEYRLINEAYEVTFAVKPTPRTTMRYWGGSSIVI